MGTRNRTIGFTRLALAAAVVMAAAAADARSTDATPTPGTLELTRGASAVVLDEDVTVTYDADGRYTQEIRRRVQILDERGRQTYAADQMAFFQPRARVEFLGGRIIRPTGETVALDRDRAREEPLSATAHPFAQPYRRLVVRYPDLQVQDTLETAMRIQSDAQVPGHYADFFLFQYENPILSKRLVIRGPASRPLRHAVRDGALAFTEERAGDQVVYTWTGRELPMIYRETGMPGLPEVAGRVVVSTLGGWPELSRKGWAQSRGRLEPDEALAEKVRELTDGLTGEHSRILALLRFVAGEVGYLDASMDVGAFLEPHAAAEVLAAGFGVGRDKSVLLAAMLRELGLEAEEALINVSRAPDTDIPSVYFERSLCAVRLSDGRTAYLDPALGAHGTLGETYAGGRPLLRLTADGAGLETVPPSPASRSLGRLEADTRLDADGGARTRIGIRGGGYYDFILRGLGRRFSGPQFVQVWQELAGKVHAGARVREFQVSDAADLAVPFAVAFDVDAPGYALAAGRFLIFRPYLMTNGFELYSLGLPRMMAPGPRRYPMDLFSTVQVVQSEHITLPAGYTILALPDPVEIAAGPARLRLSCRREGGAIRFDSEFSLDRAVLSSADYEQLRELLDRWVRNQRSMIILERQPGGGS